MPVTVKMELQQKDFSGDFSGLLDASVIWKRPLTYSCVWFRHIICGRY